GERQQEFLTDCAEYLGEWLTVQEINTGMQLVGRFTVPRSDKEFCKRAARHQVDVTPLSSHYRHSAPEQGVIMGYTGVSTKERRQGLDRLRTTFRER
ncbi:MAG: hypothetical protein ABIV25_15205, partial [Paracoccaceae bacterium]